MRKGSTRFSDVMRQTGRGSDGILHKSSKKLKTLSSVGEMDTSSCSKTLKLSKKILDDCHTVNHVFVPRKLRSALVKRQHEYVSPTNGISTFKLSSEVSNKKLEANAVTKDEEEAVAGLLALARIYFGDNNSPQIYLKKETSEAETSRSKDLVPKCAQIDVTNKSINAVEIKMDYNNVINGGNKSRKRCASHVYICRLIKDMQFMEGNMVNSHKLLKTETISSENNLNRNVGIDLNEGITASKTISQDQHCAFGVQSYFGNPFSDPSQWSRPVLPKQQIWVNSLMPPRLNPHVQPSMRDVLATKQELRSLGYQENGDLFRVDNPLTLKLTLQ
ncbi:uncharacterized protein [Rutidosis leptorrhynchoides]|uniref:uncharacterized protein n=1 Tax=Rutidosis leptorrhynchoides TaxID=125765 RepID=UPI003A9A5F23